MFTPQTYRVVMPTRMLGAMAAVALLWAPARIS